MIGGRSSVVHAQLPTRKAVLSQLKDFVLAAAREFNSQAVENSGADVSKRPKRGGSVGIPRTAGIGAKETGRSRLISPSRCGVLGWPSFGRCILFLSMQPRV
jgi:hypothetical protein